MLIPDSFSRSFSFLLSDAQFSSLTNFAESYAARAIGWTLVHFVWQAMAIALVTAVLLSLVNRRKSNLRYLIGCIGLVAMAITPMATFPYCLNQSSQRNQSSQSKLDSTVATNSAAAANKIAQSNAVDTRVSEIPLGADPLIESQLAANALSTQPLPVAVSYTHLRAPRDLSTSRMPSSA